MRLKVKIDNLKIKYKSTLGTLNKLSKFFLYVITLLHNVEFA